MSPRTYLPKDASNQTFGHLTALHREGTDKHHNATWFCRCTCGNELVVSGRSLRRGWKTDCGCRKSLTLIGHTFGLLTVFEYGGLSRKGTQGDRGSTWVCKCSCGSDKVVIVLECNLKTGNTTSCGCLKLASAKHKQSLEAAANGRVAKSTFITALMNQVKRHARRRGFSFELTIAQCDVLFMGTCFYCGVSPSNRWKNAYNYNGIDRLDSKKHYTIDNSVSCCAECNRAKNNRSMEEFLLWLDKTHSYSLKQIQALKLDNWKSHS